MNEPASLDTCSELHQAARPADGLGDLRADASGVYWLAADPDSGARRLWQWRDGYARALTPSDLDVASRVNGYGGGSHVRLGGHVYVVAGGEQALYRVSLASSDTQDAAQDEEPLERWWFKDHSRYGGLLADHARHRLLAVEETGSTREASQCLVALSETGRLVLASGADFYGAPALSPDGKRLAWVEWELPHMPWQRSRLCMAELDTAGRICHCRTWDGGGAVTQPRFSADDRLIAISDHQGWWQPYVMEGHVARPIGDVAADHVPTPWQLGECHHLWPTDHDGILMRFHEGAATLWRVDSQGQVQQRLLPEATRIVGLANAQGWLYAITQGHHYAARLERLPLADDADAPEVLFALPTPDDTPAPALISTSVSHDERVSAFVYLPAAAHGALPPLIMRVHGGPTAACYPVFDPLVRYWVRQGYAVADLNPRGSGNFGRAYRERLAGQWGRVDVDDAVAVADDLVSRQLVDPERCFIRGQSAGGFTVLNTLATTQRFRAGASLYGVTDALRLATQTHRFESGYLDWLLGDADAKRRMSPVNRLDTFAAAVIFFQGGSDTVVVPEQTHAMAKALRRRGIEAEVELFPEEGHGIRHPHNRCRMIALEVAFYRGARLER